MIRPGSTFEWLTSFNNDIVFLYTFPQPVRSFRNHWAKQDAIRAVSVMSSTVDPLGVRLSAYVLRKAPAAHPIYPRKTSLFAFRYASCSQMSCWQEAVLPPPVSDSKAWRLLSRSQVASGEKTLSILLETHSGSVPELSASRYLLLQSAADRV